MLVSAPPTRRHWPHTAYSQQANISPRVSVISTMFTVIPTLLSFVLLIGMAPKRPCDLSSGEKKAKSDGDDDAAATA